jgi:hypothetical protein
MDEAVVLQYCGPEYCLKLATGKEARGICLGARGRATICWYRYRY